VVTATSLASSASGRAWSRCSSAALPACCCSLASRRFASVSHAAESVRGLRTPCTEPRRLAIDGLLARTPPGRPASPLLPRSPRLMLPCRAVRRRRVALDGAACRTCAVAVNRVVPRLGRGTLSLSLSLPPWPWSRPPPFGS
jgi:hypothetical protein